MRQVVLCIIMMVVLGACYRPPYYGPGGGPVLAKVAQERPYYGNNPWGRADATYAPAPPQARYSRAPQASAIPQQRPVQIYNASPSVAPQIVSVGAEPAPARVVRSRPVSVDYNESQPIAEAVAMPAPAPTEVQSAALVSKAESAPTSVSKPKRRPTSLSSTPKPTARPSVMTRRETVGLEAGVPETEASEAVEVASLAHEPTVTTTLSVLDAVTTPDSEPTIPLLASNGQEIEANLTAGKIPASIGIANIKSEEAAQVDVGGLENSTAGEVGTISWAEASALLQAGEVGSYVNIGGQDILVTLCSGRGVMTTQPKQGAILNVSVPKIICGRQAALQAN